MAASRSSTSALQVSSDAIEAFVEDVGLLWCGFSNAGAEEGGSDSACPLIPVIPVLESPPSPLVFSRDFVSRSRPCIIRNALSASSHSMVSSLDAMVEAYPDLKLTVDVTPDGHGDCLRRVEHVDNETTEPSDPSESSAVAEATATVKDAAPGSFSHTVTGSATTSITKQSTTIFVQPAQEIMTLSRFRQCLRRQAAATKNSNNNNAVEPDPVVTVQHIQNRVFAVCNDSSCSTSSSNSRSSGAKTDTSRRGEGNGTDSVSNNGPSSPTNNDDCINEESVVYYSRQNDCFRTELAPIWQDQGQGEIGILPASFAWAEAAFGDNISSPEAINLWIGNERSVSAMHKDPYENLYVVLSGEKVFVLCPPCDAPFLYEQPPRYQSGRFVRGHCSCAVGTTRENTSHNGNDDNDSSAAKDVADTDSWKVRMDHNASLLPWVSVDVSTNTRHGHDNHSQQSPLARHAHAVTVHVAAGDLLYIPALWYHQVTQTCETIAVNYWYNMTFESPLWCYHALLSQLQPVSAESSTQPLELPMATSHESANCKLDHDSGNGFDKAE